jgi:hypothetical protein
MQYLLLIYENEKNWQNLAEKARNEAMAEYMQFTQDIQKSKHMLGGNALQPTNSATTVRLRDGKRLSTDGPFAETKEQLGGYYLIEARDLDDALKVAARIPSAKWGSIEVRPIMKFD